MPLIRIQRRVFAFLVGGLRHEFLGSIEEHVFPVFGDRRLCTGGDAAHRRAREFRAAAGDRRERVVVGVVAFKGARGAENSRYCPSGVVSQLLTEQKISGHRPVWDCWVPTVRPGRCS